MRIQIVTCNSVYENGVYIKGFHEIHEIDNLQNKEHIVATIKPIVANNIFFKPENATLDMVIISGNNVSIIEKVVDHFKSNPIGVEIIETETAYMKD